ncbi:pilus assembly PilX family protein [Acinetobacter sp. A2]|uniref:pilus assembly PilX family protein n=1 Tax=Acinetobacter sp. A2 TaxID=362457 RepID=UPI003AF3585D
MINKKQRGATLIVVMILLLIISVIGLYAIRHSLFSLKLATNAQVQALLMQTSDVALSHLERNFNQNEATNIARTPVGQVLLNGNQGKELQFCYKPTEINSTNKSLKNSMFFNLGDFRVIERKAANSVLAAETVSSGDIDAFCDPETMFSISRKALVTQVAVINPDDPAVELNRFDLTAQGTDLKDVNVETKRVRVIVTTLAPALSTASVSEIKACLKTRLLDDVSLRNQADLTTGQVKVETAHECLSKLGVPVNTQVAEYVVNLSESRT